MTVQILPFAPRLASEREWAMYRWFRCLRHQERDPDDPLLDDRTTEKLMKRGDPEWESLYFAAIEEEAPDFLMLASWAFRPRGTRKSRVRVIPRARPPWR